VERISNQDARIQTRIKDYLVADTEPVITHFIKASL